MPDESSPLETGHSATLEALSPLSLVQRQCLAAARDRLLERFPSGWRLSFTATGQVFTATTVTKLLHKGLLMRLPSGRLATTPAGKAALSQPMPTKSSQQALARSEATYRKQQAECRAAYLARKAQPLAWRPPYAEN